MTNEWHGILKLSVNIPQIVGDEFSIATASSFQNDIDATVELNIVNMC